jgi:dihydroneopterin aldolase
MADRISLHGLRVLGVHGDRPEERARAQPFEVDVEAELDLTLPGRSDRLSDTVDYGGLVDAVNRVVACERFHLLEALAERIAEVALVDERIQTVTVTVRKLRPPVPVDLASVGVQVTRGRA